MRTISDVIVPFGVENFVLLDRITSYSRTALTAEKIFTDAPAYLALESMAQAGGMHFRKHMEFGSHAFLLSIPNVPFPVTTTITGTAQIDVCNTAITDTTAAYTITFTCGETCLHGEYMFGCTPFGKEFSQTVLTTHYRELFTCLLTA